jgi:heptosyltransferase-2
LGAEARKREGGASALWRKNQEDLLKPDIGRLVIRAPNPLGDAIMALPAMAALRAAFPDAHLIVAAAPAVAPLFQEITQVAPNQVVVTDKRLEAAQLREAQPDAVVLFTNSFRTAWVARQAGIGQRWGYRAYGRSLLLTRAIARPRRRLHQSEYYQHLVRELGFVTAAIDPQGLTPRGLHETDGFGVAPPGSPTAASRIDAVAPGSVEPGDHPRPSIQITPATSARVDAFLHTLGVDRSTPLVGFAPGAAYGHAKRWPPERVAGVVGRLQARGVACLLVGAAGDRDAGREIESSLPGGSRVVNVIGRTDLRLLAGLLAACRVFVSNDSGAMHLAAAVGVPVAAIFGPTDERVTAPLGDHDVIVQQVFCRPCMLRDCPIDHRCMRRVTEEMVFDTVVRRLDAGPP